MAFWCAVVKSGDKASVFVPPAEGWLLHLSQASLPATVPEGKRVSVQLKHGAEDRHPIVLCTLTAGRLDTVSLDLFLDHYAEFSLLGFQGAEVHLTGYYSPPDGVAGGPGDSEEEDEDFELDEDQDEDEDEEALLAAAAGAGKQKHAVFGHLVDGDDEDDEDEDEDDEDEFEDEDGGEEDEPQEPGVTRRPHVTIREIKEGEDDEGEDEDEDEEDDDEEEEEPAAAAVAPPSKQKGASKQQQPVTPAAAAKATTAANAATPSSSKKEQLQAKGAADKAGKGQQPAKDVSTPGNKRAAVEPAAQPQAKKQAKDTPVASKGAAQQETQPRPAEQAVKSVEVKPAKKNIKTLPNGFSIEEVAMGAPDGKLAKQGKAVKVNYVGRLKSNGKIFDSTQGKKPFGFRLGVGEVIKGWDLGVEGMREGDRRRLVIPPQLAYGTQGVRGAIPPNATLLFDVELVSVK